MNQLNLRIYRQPGPIDTPGELWIDGAFYCYTMEDKVRPAGEKVPGETAILPGKYRIVVTKSPAFGIYLPRFKSFDPNNKTMFGGLPIDDCGVLFHGGNTHKDSRGCVLVGRNRFTSFSGQGNTISGSTATDLTLLIQAAINQGKEVVCEIS